MTRALDLRALNQIVEVRRVQVAATEMRFWEARRVLAELNAKHDACCVLISQMQAGWLAAVSSGSVQLAAARAYGVRIEGLFADLSELDREIAGAEKHRNELATELGLCQARRKASEEFERKSIRREARRSEEAWVTETSERHATRVFMS
ncbi:MAG TPA: hypothetical protein VG407_07195 [Caulobacteraceae bacterium]|jgi:hypothetical protein|nr:hypothetical protein [Caulobacteraceae bacterium]